ncbi:MAG: copper chaperone PCu(A)C [Gemmatimonadaceae bacterium]|nr:copper chaperone PCu(A)C [Gemmatimonadaceae bacterium]
MNARVRVAAVIISALLSAVVTACSGESAVDRTPRAHSAWSRPADSGAVGVAYFVLVNHDTVPLALSSVNTPVARAAEVHETMQHEGMAHMQARPTLEVAAGDSAVFNAGGLHVMLIDLHHALVAGDSIPLTLHFARGDSLLVRVGVRSATGLP